MRTVYLIDRNRTYTGETLDIEDGEGRRSNQIPVEPPALGEGESAVWAGNRWVVTTTPPTPAGPQVPTSVPTWAAKIALIDFDLYDDGIAFMDAMTGKDQARAKVQWENKQTFNRDNPLIQAFKDSKGLTEADLDNLFVYADQKAKEG